MANIKALNNLLNELVLTAWADGNLGEDDTTEVDRIKRLIVALVAPDEQDVELPGTYLSVGPVEDDWIVTGVPGQPSMTVGELRANCGDD